MSKQVSKQFKELSKKVKQQDLKLSINNGELTVQEIHLMPANIFNAIPLYKLCARKQVIAKELVYSFDGELFKTIMQQVEITVKNASEIKGKNIIFEYGLLVENEFEYVNMGEYYIKDVEDDKNKEELVVTGYDKMINFMVQFKQSDLKITYPCTLKQLVLKMCEVCGVELYSADFYNADLTILEDFFTVQQLTYRDVLEKIAEATETTMFIKDDKLYLCKIGDVVQELDTSYLSELVIGEKFGPVNALVLGRGAVEDNIEAKDQESITNSGRCEIRFDENEFLDTRREELIDNMLERIKGLEYHACEASNLGLMWLEPCDVLVAKDRENSPYKTIYLSARVTINTGISGEMEAKIPEVSTTEHRVTTKEQKKALKTERMALKHEGIIRDLIEETTENSQKLTQHEQTIDAITNKVEQIEDVTNTVEGIKTIALGNCMEGELLELHIYGNNTVFDYLYPADDLYPSDNLYPRGDSRIVVNNEVYELGVTDVLRQNSDVCDEFVLENGQAKVIRRVNKSGSTKAKEKVEDLGELKILLQEGTNTITIKNYTAKLKAKYIRKNEFSDTFIPKVELGTQLIQNSEAVKLAWNQISDFIQMMIINSNASFAILDKDKKVMMYLDKTGQHFCDSQGNVFGEMGVKKVGEQNYISFSVEGDYGQEIQNGMSWGVTTKDGKYWPILHITNFLMGAENTDETYGELVLNYCNLVLGGIGTGIKSGNALLTGDPAIGGMIILDTATYKNLLSIYPDSDLGYAFLQFLDDIKFYRNQAGSNSLKIGDGDKYCLLSDDGHVVCYDLNCYENAYVWEYFTAKKGISCTDGYVDGIAFINNSKLETKKNISKYNQTALKEILKTDIYKFNYKAEDDEVKKHIGFIIGDNYEYSKEITAVDKNGKEVGVDLYSMVSMAYKAIQEQQEQIKQLEEKDKQKDKLIANLIKRVEELEANK